MHTLAQHHAIQAARQMILSAATVLLTLSANYVNAAETQPPNLLLILADDLGYSDLSCYGSEIETPNLDKLAAGGLRFTQFCNTARCWPSRAALLTGYYAQQVRRDKVEGVPSGASGVRPTWARLLPDYLRERGYRSYHSGKWHIDGLPLAGGFDRSYLLQDQGRFFNPKSHYEDDKPLPAVEPGTPYYGTTAIADHAIRVLKEHAEKHRDKPFFHYLAFTAPHFPLHALPEDIDRYRDRYRQGWDKIREARWQRQQELKIAIGRLSKVELDVGPPYDFPEAIEQLGPGEINRPLPWDQLTDEQREFQATKMAIHAAMVDRMDRELGRILDQLRESNQLDNTLILFMSDNGASAEIMVRDDGHDPQATPGSAATYLCLGPGWSTAANTPHRRHKTWVHQGGIATPLIVHWPKGIAARGEIRRTPGHLIDVVPTFLEICNVDREELSTNAPLPPLPGKSLVPAFAQDIAIERQALWWSHEDNNAIRVGDWKLVQFKGGAWELYDLSLDHSEDVDLAGKHPEKVKELAELWTALRDQFQQQALQDATVDAARPATSPDKLGKNKQNQSRK